MNAVTSNKKHLGGAYKLDIERWKLSLNEWSIAAYKKTKHDVMMCNHYHYPVFRIYSQDA